MGDTILVDPHDCGTLCCVDSAGRECSIFDCGGTYGNANNCSCGLFLARYQRRAEKWVARLSVIVQIREGDGIGNNEYHHRSYRVVDVLGLQSNSHLFQDH
jgi:hypothetical protein